MQGICIITKNKYVIYDYFLQVLLAKSIWKISSANVLDQTNRGISIDTQILFCASFDRGKVHELLLEFTIINIMVHTRKCFKLRLIKA